MKTNIFKKYKKIFLVFPLFLVLIFLYLAFFKLNILVSIAMSLFTHGSMKMEKVEFFRGSNLREGRIEITNSKLYDKKLLIADTPKIVIDYKDYKIEKIDLFSPKAVLVRDDSNINFVTVFVGKDKEKKDNKKSKNDTRKEIKKEKKENKKDPILKRINIYDADLNYVDISYSEKISQNVYNVNGYVEFLKGYKTDLKFSGENKEEKYTYTFSNEKKSYDMLILLNNIKATSPLVQYGYDSEGEIRDVDGVVDLDLRINDDGFFGKGSLKNGSLIYEDLGVPIKNINLDMNFLGKKIDITADYLFFDKEGKFYVEYNDGIGVDVGFKLNNVLYNEVANYKILKDSGIVIDDFNIDEVNILLSVKNHFSATVDFKSKDGFKKSPLAMKDISGTLTYENGELRVKDIKALAMLDKEGKTIEREITGNVLYKGSNGRVRLHLRNKDKTRDSILSHVNLRFLFGVGKDSFNFKTDSNIIDFNGKYEYKTNILYVNQDKNFDFKYDMKNKKIITLKGYLDSKLDKYKVKTEINTKDGYFIEIDSKMKDNEDTVRGSVEGYVNLENNLSYDIKIKAKDVNITEQDLGTLTGSMEGYIKGEETGNINGKFLLDNLGYSMGDIKVSDVLGVVNLDKNKSMSVIFQGEVGSVKYNDFEIKGFKAGIKYGDDTLKIINVSNKFLTLSGNYSIINSKLELFAKGRDINKDVIAIGDINYNIPLIDGSIVGNLEDLNAKFEINDGLIDLGEERYVSFGGAINYKDNKVFAENFKINENKINFDYDIKDKKGSYRANIFEETISDFVTGAKFRIIGTTNGIIEDTKVNGDFKGSINSIYFNGTKFPNLTFDGNYDNDIINLKNVNILSSDDKKNVLRAEGVINIKDKYLDFGIPKQNINLSDILSSKAEGKINIEAKVEGLFEDIEYFALASSNGVSYNGLLAQNIDFDLRGNKEKAVLNKFVAEYKNNSLKINGEYNIPDSKYKFFVNSSEVDLSNLSSFLKNYGIDTVSGRSKINLVFTEKVPVGTINLKDINIGSKKYGINLNKLHGDMEIQKGVLDIKKFNGYLNDGTLNIKGHLEVNKLIDQLLGENFGKIDYNLVLDGRDINYSFEDFFDINFNTRISVRNNMVSGNITVNKGNINKILTEDFGIVSIVKNFLKDFFNKNKSEKIFIENTKSFGSRGTSLTPRINIGFNIDKGIDINVYRITSFLTNIKGKIMGQGRLTGNLGKLNFTGETSIRDGEFILNGNKFTVDRAMVLFNNKDEYIPDVNPNIAFSTSSIINNKNMELSLTE